VAEPRVAEKPPASEQQDDDAKSHADADIGARL
jgi:hypothetical protein